MKRELYIQQLEAAVDALQQQNNELQAALIGAVGRLGTIESSIDALVHLIDQLCNSDEEPELLDLRHTTLS